MEISLEQACRILNEAYVLYVDGELAGRAMRGVNGDPKNEFMTLLLGPDDVVTFCEGDNQTVTVDGSSMWFTNDDGGATAIAPLFLANLKQMINEM